MTRPVVPSLILVAVALSAWVQAAEGVAQQPPPPSFMDDVLRWLKEVPWAPLAQLIGAVSSLLWPLLVLAIVLVFRRELAQVIVRLKRGKLFGQEFELAEALERLDRTAKKAVAEMSALPEPEGQPVQDRDSVEITRRVLDVATTSPKAALMLVATEIEAEVRALVQAKGIASSYHRGIPPLLTAVLSDAVPPHVADSIKAFWEVRNTIVHGRSAEPEDVLRAIDSGLAILAMLRAIPRRAEPGAAR